MNHKIEFYFRHVCFQLSINGSSDLVHRLQRDFYFFRNKNQNITKSCLLEIAMEQIPWEKIPQIPATSQSKSCLTYDSNGLRFNDYYGDVLTISDFSKNKFWLYTPDLQRAHEISYLLILSIVGKIWDQGGLHRLHAFGIKKNDLAVLGIMPMKGGKSTLFKEMLAINKELEIIADDAPLIDHRGWVHANPLRMGLEQFPEDMNLKIEDICVLERKHFGKKYLLGLDLFPHKIARSSSKVVLFTAQRSNLQKGHFKKCSRFNLVRPLVESMLIGVGLPMIKEYFLRPGFKDFLLNGGIFFKRLKAMSFLLLRAQCYQVVLGTDKKFNALLLQDFWPNKSSQNIPLIAGKEYLSNKNI